MISREDLRDAFIPMLNHLGGEEAFRKMIDEFYSIMKDDILIGFYFEPFDLTELSSQQSDFLLNAAMIRPGYRGRGPGGAHLALPPILDGHFDRRHFILRELLRKHKVPENLIDTWIGFEEQFRQMIVKS